MSSYVPVTKNFAEAKRASMATLDSISSLLRKAIKGYITTVDGKKEYSGYIDDDNTIFALEKALSELEYWIEQMPEPEPDEEDDSPRTKASDFKKNIEIVKNTLNSNIDLNNAFVEMSNNGAPFIEFKSVEDPDQIDDNMPYIELWGKTTNNEPVIMKDLNGMTSLKGDYGTLDDSTAYSMNHCRFNIEIAKKDASGNYITKPNKNAQGQYNNNTIYLVVQGETVTDSGNSTVQRKYYDFSMIDKTVKIVEIGNRLMARVNFSFNFPAGKNRDKYLEYPTNNFAIQKRLPPYSLSDIDATSQTTIDEYYEDNGFWLYVIDNRQASA